MSYRDYWRLFRGARWVVRHESAHLRLPMLCLHVDICMHVERNAPLCCGVVFDAFSSDFGCRRDRSPSRHQGGAKVRWRPNEEQPGRVLYAIWLAASGGTDVRVLPPRVRGKLMWTPRINDPRRRSREEKNTSFDRASKRLRPYPRSEGAIVDLEGSIPRCISFQSRCFLLFQRPFQGLPAQVSIIFYQKL